MRNISALGLIDQRTQPGVILLDRALDRSIRYVYTSVPNSFVVSPELWSERMHNRVPSDVKGAGKDSALSSPLSTRATCKE